MAGQGLSGSSGLRKWTAQATGKNIVIFSDGTGQEGGVGEANTNVYKLFMMIEDRTAAQTAFYDQGLGTKPGTLLEGMTGTGITHNILDAYQFISEHYECGDQLFFFGFSRGATTVRSLAGFVALFGILPHSRPDLAKRAYAIYRDASPERRRDDRKAFLERNGTTFCNIKFVGVWDTVAALGLPVKALDAVFGRFETFKHSFHDLSLNPVVQYAFHALAIDEEREIFAPTPWHVLDV